METETETEIETETDLLALEKELSRHEVSSDRLVLSTERNNSGGFGVLVRAKLMPTVPVPTGQPVPEEAEEGTSLGTVPKSSRAPSNKSSEVGVKILIGNSNVPQWRIRKRALREMLVWSQLRHENIAVFVGYHFNLNANPAEAWLISSWETEGDVYKFLRSRKLHPLDRMRLQILRDACRGLEYMHGKDMYHGDLKGGNVLIRSDPVEGGIRAMLCDFGLAQMTHDETFSILKTEGGWSGSVKWCSPEVLDGVRSAQGDIWAFGWLTWEVITEKEPFDDCPHPMVAFKRIFDHKLPPLNSPPVITVASFDPLRKRMRICWQKDPLARGTIVDCLNDMQHLFAHFKPTDEELNHSLLKTLQKKLPEAPESRQEIQGHVNFDLDNALAEEVPTRVRPRAPPPAPPGSSPADLVAPIGEALRSAPPDSSTAPPGPMTGAARTRARRPPDRTVAPPVAPAGKAQAHARPPAADLAAPAGTVSSSAPTPAPNATPILNPPPHGERPGWWRALFCCSGPARQRQELRNETHEMPMLPPPSRK